MAVVYLTGVLEDGTQPRPKTVPANTRQTLAVTQGASTQIVLQVTTAAGVPVTDGDLQLRVRLAPGDEPLLLTPGIWQPMLGAGMAMFAILPTNFQGYQWGRYIYDVKLDRDGDVNFVVPASPFVLQPAV